jgi:hypothetical protein
VTALDDELLCAHGSSADDGREADAQVREAGKLPGGAMTSQAVP